MTASAASRDAVLCVCLNPVIQKTLVFDRIIKDEVNRCREHRVDASGKGVNVARVLVQRGTRAIQLTQAGGPSRDWFLELCARDRIDLRWVESDSEIRFCHTLVDRGDGSATELVEEAMPVSPGTGERILAQFERVLPGCSAMVISGTKAPGFPSEIFPTMTRRAREEGLLVVLDIKGEDLKACLPHRPDIVKPNLRELLDTFPIATGRAQTQSEELLRAHVEELAGGIAGQWGARLVVTRGGSPTWYWNGESLGQEEVHRRAALNPTGSGDAFTAGLVAVLLEGGDLQSAVREGGRLGGLNAEQLKPGSIL